ncbi:NAD(P)-binding protein [Aureobasidium subglaciale]|nr:NAD(P)-binding protein [Aureobasidium subglaciale]
MTIPIPALQPSAIAARDELSKRSIPHMVLSQGDAKSLTAPPTFDFGTNDTDCALGRFRVDGNAVVTGGTGTLGLAACTALLEHGLSGLAIFDVNAAQSEPHLTKLRQRFPSRTIACYQVDVTDDVAVQDAVDLATETLGSINHLLCFSGIVGCVNAMDMSAAQWRRIMDVNTTGSFLCAQAVARKMARQGTGGSIVFTASISAHRVNYPQPQAAYNVSKAALITLKNCLAAEWARYGIRTNSVSPGYMDTILNEGPGIAGARDVWAARNPTGRMGTPDELTGAIVMLSSTTSSYINGTDIVIDGGAIVF